MKKEELKDYMQHISEKAKMLLTRDGKLIPVAFVHYDNDIEVLGLSFRNNDEKEIQFLFLKKLVEKKNADAICTVIESWYVSDIKENITVSPSNHPLRKECILLYGESEDSRITIIQLFENKNGTIVFGEKIEDYEDIISLKFNFGILNRRKQNTNLGYLS